MAALCEVSTSLSNIPGGSTYRKDMLNAQILLLFAEEPRERQFLSITQRLELLPNAAEEAQVGQKEFLHWHGLHKEVLESPPLEVSKE